MGTVEFTAPGDDLDSNTTAAEYVIKYYATAGNLSGPNFALTEFNTLLTHGDLVESTLDPVTGGTVKQLKIKTATFEPNRKYVMAMRARDKADNFSPVSNKVQFCSACFLQPGTSSTTTTTTPSLEPGTSSTTTTTTPSPEPGTSSTTTNTTTPSSGCHILHSECFGIISLTIVSLLVFSRNY